MGCFCGSTYLLAAQAWSDAVGVERCSWGRAVQLGSSGAAGVERCSWGRAVQLESSGAAGVERCSWGRAVQPTAFPWGRNDWRSLAKTRAAALHRSPRPKQGSIQ
jgi:hypothetical protein